MSSSSSSSWPVSSSSLVIPPPSLPLVPVWNGVDSVSSSWFPVHRIYCVGRNYEDHAIEMGGKRGEMPFFFTKPADAIVPCGYPMLESKNDNPDFPRSRTTISYPLSTQNLHYEIELVVAIGKGGTQISEEEALDYIYGYAVGVDLTRRDLQTIAKQSGKPWDSAKAFDQSAPISYIVPKQYATANLPNDSPIWLTVQKNTVESLPTLRQNGTLAQMIWKIPEIVSILSQQFHLQPGDLIFTGTPSGVGPLEPGDIVKGGVQGLAELEFSIV